ncbi:MAG: Ig-like domain-containing protein [Dysgonamonadaceae bacterium]|jgi:uncharacterized protein (TIGR02145 family)|nr:Ig-like domain-containing protein [Dysgonamonadaceae bacterium]
MKMKKKMMFLFLLFPMVFGTADLYAQVTIGSDDEPHSGAILDLRSDNKGLKLPTVSLTDTAAFQLSTNPSDAASAIGMTVYNTNDDIIGGRGQGIYTWNGTWIYSGGAPRAAIPVNRIVITSPENVNKVEAGKTLQLTDSILPANASNKKLAWSVPWSGTLTAGKAVVNDTGLVTGIKPGNVTVRASAIDGSGVYRDFVVSVQPTEKTTNIRISSENGQSSVDVGSTLQLVAEIIPETASTVVKWESANTAFATVGAATGQVTGMEEGQTYIRVRTLDGLPVLYDSVNVTVKDIGLPDDTARVVIAGNSYLTYNYNGTVWMIENMRGDADENDPPKATYYENDATKRYSAYYTRTQALKLCPTGGEWQLPTKNDAEELDLYLTRVATEQEKVEWRAKGLNGRYVGSTPTWTQYDVYGFYFLRDAHMTIVQTKTGFTYETWSNGNNLWHHVRCVKYVDP